MASIKISNTNPFEDTLFLIRAECASRTPAHMRMHNIELIMDAFHDTMKEIGEKKIVPLQGIPTGTED